MRRGYDNGQKGFLSEDETYLNDGNTISFGQDTATIYYQEIPYFTGDKIKILCPIICGFKKENAQFFLTSMRLAFSKFAWGSSRFNVDVLKDQKVMLPTKHGKIDFEFMENFIAELEAQRYAELEAYLSVTGLKDTHLSLEEKQALADFDNIPWGEFRMGALFERIKTRKLPYKANDLPKRMTGKYVLPCLTSSFNNQGLNYFVPKDGATILKNVISIPSNSDVYRAYYQSNDFTVLSDAYAIRWDYNESGLSRLQYLFTVAGINKAINLPIYSYKNKLGGWKVVRNKYIHLPVKNGEIDFEFMNLLIAAIQKLIIKDVVAYSEKKIAATKKVIDNRSRRQR